ncbi:MAG: response regulator [Nitrospirae bacterium]|nr:MAG: response regulator [Nitrospirota bacterium]
MTENNKKKVLLVDDEEYVLHSLKRLLLDEDYEVLTGVSGKEGLELLQGNEVAVIVSDHRMPEMTGVDFLEKARLISPDTVRIILTGYADVTAAIDAINRGGAYKFITKPWDQGDFMRVVSDAVRQYETVKALRSSDEGALLSLAQAVELKDPYTRGHCERVADYALIIAGSLGLPEELKKDIKHGSWLHDCGKIGVPDAILNFNGPLYKEQLELVKNHSRWGANMASLARLPQAAVNVILYHHERYDGCGYPAGLKGGDIPLEARIAAIADVYDALTSDRPYRLKMDELQARELMLSQKESHFDPKLMNIFFNEIACLKTDVI